MAFRAHIRILNVSLNLCVAVYQLWCLILHHQKALPWISLKTTESAGLAYYSRRSACKCTWVRSSSCHFKHSSKGNNLKGSIVFGEDMHREPGICKTAAIQWCDPVALPHPNFRRGKVTQKSPDSHEIIYILRLWGSNPSKINLVLQTKKWGRDFEKAIAAEIIWVSIVHQTIQSGDATWPVLQCWIFYLLVRILTVGVSDIHMVSFEILWLMCSSWKKNKNLQGFVGLATGVL